MNRPGRAAGWAIQVLVTGSLLFVALFRLAGLVGVARVFQYEGF